LLEILTGLAFAIIAFAITEKEKIKEIISKQDSAK
jgi:hypothetical protein